MDSSCRISYELEVNNEDIQSLQDAFCKSNNMYMICVGKANGQITSFSGSKSEEDFVDSNFPTKLKKEIMDSFVDGAPENIVERTGTEEYFLYKGVAIRSEQDEIIGFWLCFGIDKDKAPINLTSEGELAFTTSEAFDRAAALIEAFSKYYFKEKFYSSRLKAKLSNEKLETKKVEGRLAKNEIMTTILRLMESQNSFSKVVQDILNEGSEYIACTNAALIQLSTDGKSADMILECARDDHASVIEEFQSIPVIELPFMNGKPYTISSDATLPADFEKFFELHKIEAAIFLPLNVNDEAAMYLCFLSVEEERQWSVSDIRFANDIKHIIHNILMKKITNNSLASSYSALESILQKAGYGVVVADTDAEEILYTNDTFQELFSNDIDRVAVQELIFDKRYTMSELNGYSANGSGKWFDISMAEIKWVDGRNVRLITFYDTTDIRTVQMKAEKQAQEDSLTGLYNRQACEKDISLEYHVSKKLGKEFAVLMFDIDDFSNINQGLGYRLADELLEFVARSINDISVIKNKCYRVGGDEFAVILDHENYSNLDFVIKRIMNLFDNPWVINEKEYNCTISMGIVKAPTDIEDATSILTRLTIALHGAKETGKNNFKFYNPKLEEKANKQSKLETELKKAVEKGCREFEIKYQPIMEFVGGVPNCYGAEALIRWNSPELGLMMPDQFLEKAEELKLISDIGQYVIFEAAKTCKHWNDFGHPTYKVGVNVSAAQLCDDEFLEGMDKILKATAIIPDNLTLEVTSIPEGVDLQRISEVLDKVRAMGCRVALDDFGQVNTDLSFIRKLPLDILKIDRSLISEMDKSKYSQAFIKAVTELADSINIDVCIEGVEEDKQANTVEEMSVDLAQGFYFDKPLSKEEFGKKYI